MLVSIIIRIELRGSPSSDIYKKAARIHGDRKSVEHSPHL